MARRVSDVPKRRPVHLAEREDTRPPGAFLSGGGEA